MGKIILLEPKQENPRQFKSISILAHKNNVLKQQISIALAGNIAVTFVKELF